MAGPSQRASLRRGAAVAALALAGCAGLTTGIQRQPGTLANGTFTPGRPPAANYGPDSTRSCQRGVPDQLVGDLADAMKGQPVPVLDPRLCAVGEALLGWDQPELRQSMEVETFLAYYNGLPSRYTSSTIITMATEESKQIEQTLLEDLKQRPKPTGEMRFGLATQRLGKGSTRVAFVLEDAKFDLDPLPRTLALNTTSTVNGKLLGEYENPRLFIGTVEGKVETVPGQPGKAFTAPIACGAKAGTITIELRAQLGGADQVLADLPVGCGVELAKSVPVAAPQAAATPGDLTQQEHALFDLLNADRTAGGLPQLTWDDSVAGVARAYAEKLGSGGEPSSQEILANLKKADIVSPVVLANPVAALDVGGAQKLFSSKPTNRANYMNADVNYGGVGIAPVAAKEGRPAGIIAVEIFVKELAVIDTAPLRETVRSGVVRKRSDARAPALSSDPALEKVAQSYATELAKAKGALPAAREAEILAPVQTSYSNIKIIAGYKADPTEFAEEPGTIAPGNRLGIGVAQGTAPNVGKNAIYVAILIGTQGGGKAPAKKGKH